MSKFRLSIGLCSDLAEAPPHAQNRNELQVMVLTDLAEICKKVAENSAATEDLHQRAGQFVAEFNSLEPYRGKGDVDQHFQAGKLLIQIARFLPEIAALHSRPAGSSNLRHRLPARNREQKPRREEQKVERP